jgi:hypothetical protein
MKHHKKVFPRALPISSKSSISISRKAISNRLIFNCYFITVTVTFFPSIWTHFSCRPPTVCYKTEKMCIISLSSSLFHYINECREQQEEGPPSLQSTESRFTRKKELSTDCPRCAIFYREEFILIYHSR